MDGVRLAPAREEDVPVVLRLIAALGEYEKLAHEVTATEERLRDALFGAAPAAEVVIAWSDRNEPIGFALFFHNFSTFLARRGLYLEDLFVVPEWRGRGVGRRLLGHLAQVAVERGCGRMDWAVLDWNEPAIGFYRRLGARLLDEWRICRLTGAEIARLAGEV